MYIDEILKKSFFSEQLEQVEPKLAQCIFGWRGFKFDYMKGPAFFQREIITKSQKYIDEV